MRDCRHVLGPCVELTPDSRAQDTKRLSPVGASRAAYYSGCMDATILGHTAAVTQCSAATDRVYPRKFREVDMGACRAIWYDPIRGYRNRTTNETEYCRSEEIGWSDAPVTSGDMIRIDAIAAYQALKTNPYEDE